MNHVLRRTALGLLLAGASLLPVVAGKTSVGQSLLVVGWVALVVGLLLVAGRLPRASAATVASGGKEKGSRAPSLTAPAVGEAPWRPDRVDWLLAAFVVGQWVSLAVSVYKFATLLYGLEVLAAAGLFWVGRYGLTTERQRRLALWALTAGGALAAVWGLREYVRTVFFLGQPEWRIFGTFYNPNCLAGYLLLALFPAVALLLGSQTRTQRPPAPSGPSSRRREAPQGDRGKTTGAARPPEAAREVARPRYPEIGAAFATVLMLVALLLTGSKAALAAFFLGAVACGWLMAGQTRRRQLWRGLVLAGVLVLLAGAMAAPPLRVRLLSAFGGQSHSAKFRAYTWQSTLDMIRERPWLGFGGGAYEQAFPRFAIAGFTRQAHQSFLQIAAECGVPVLLVGLGWGGLVALRLRRGARTGDLMGALACAAAVGALGASAVQELADYAWYVPAVGGSFFLLAGVGVGWATGGANGEPDRSGGRSTATGLAGLGLAVVVLGVCLVWGRAEGWGSVGDRRAAAGNYPGAAAAYEQARRWNPLQARWSVQRSKVLEGMAGGDGGKLVEAVTERLRATQLQPTEPVNYVALSRLYQEAGDTRSALKAAEEALKWYPHYPRGLAQLAAVQDAAGEQGLALKTYAQLAALYHSPVGQCPALTGMLPETSYAVAWMALANYAQRGGDLAQADQWYGQAVGLVSQAVAGDRSLREQSGGELEFVQGRATENESLADLLREQLEGQERLAADFRWTQLSVALGDETASRHGLERLAREVARPRDWTEKHLRAWVILRQAQRLLAEKQEKEAVALAAKGLGLARGLMGRTVEAGSFWLAADQAELDGLRQWAETVACAPK